MVSDSAQPSNTGEAGVSEEWRMEQKNILKMWRPRSSQTKFKNNVNVKEASQTTSGINPPHLGTAKHGDVSKIFSELQATELAGAVSWRLRRQLWGTTVSPCHVLGDMVCHHTVGARYNVGHPTCSQSGPAPQGNALQTAPHSTNRLLLHKGTPYLSIFQGC